MKGRRRVNLEVGWAEADLFGKTVEVGDHEVPEFIFVKFPGVDGQPELEMTIDSSSGVPKCTRVMISALPEGREVRNHDLRQADLETWIESIVPVFMDEIVDRGGGDFPMKTVQRVGDGDAAYARAARKELQKARRAARRKISPDLLQRVAEVYRSEGSRSDEARPAKAVRTAFAVSQRTAYRYISEARRLGFLEPAEDQA